MSIQPFYIGQRVVALDAGKTIKKNNVYTVNDVFQCKCGEWHINLLELAGEKGYMSCEICGGIAKKPSWHIGGHVKHFAPIESTFQSISFEKVVEIESPLIGVN